MEKEKTPLGQIMETTLEKLRGMVDVNTIVGEPIETTDGITIIPISKASFGFASGGSDFQTKNQAAIAPNAFGGGSGAAVSITPVAFLVVKDGSVRVLTLSSPANTSVDRIIEMVPEVFDKVTDFIDRNKESKE